MSIDIDGTPLERCPECNAIVANLGGHICGSRDRKRSWLDNNRPNIRITAVIREFDDEPMDDDVLVSSASKYSRGYHIPDPANPDLPACGRRIRGEGTHWKAIPRDLAYLRRYFPCSVCHDIDLDRVERVLLERGVISAEEAGV